MDYRKFIVRNPKICGGVPILKGTRVPRKTVLAHITEGLSDEEILDSYPSLKSEHLRAAVVFAAKSAQDDIPQYGTVALR